ncbi:hypothetical protein BZM26_28850 [Paraburkholderia strydomiana]|nr:hypothetical protein BZM26_28850 [Paraburkholderia strydomiana]
MGHLLGDKAREILGPGELIRHETNIAQALSETPHVLERNVANRTFVYEAAFSYKGVVSRADAFVKLDDGWRMVEVKASTAIKEYYLQDCAVQSWVAEGAGYAVREVHLAHLNNQFVYRGDGDYRGLLTFVDVTQRIQSYKSGVESRVADFRVMLSGAEPDIQTGDHCGAPFECPFMHYCSAQEPASPEHPVEILHGNTARRLRADGYDDLLTVPAAAIPSASQLVIWRATRLNEVFYDASVKKELDALGYPRYFLDFETVSSPVPVWAKIRPYQQVPFQWSCHTESSPGILTHQEFLDVSGNLPAEEFARSMLATLGSTGPIVVYNASFEASRIRELAQLAPEHSTELTALLERIVDLLPLVRKYYYHPAMMGSYSIKAVVPTMCAELDYAELDGVADGSAAQRAWWDVADPACSERHARETRASLLRYCKADTLAMVAVLQFLARGNPVILDELGCIETTASIIRTTAGLRPH